MAIDTLDDLNWTNKMYDSWRQVSKTITFDGGTANAIGDHDGTGDPFDIFTVTGTVKVKVYAICTTNLAGASSTLEVGTATTTAGIIAQTTGTDIDAGEIWHDASPDAQVEAASVVAEKIVANGADIVGTVGTANITAGVIKFICLWKPVSTDGNVVAA
jgi:hypothetical protein